MTERHHLTCSHCGKPNVVAGLRPVQNPHAVTPEPKFNVKCWSCLKPLPQPMR